MKRIDTKTAVNGRFIDGNKITGQKATQFDASWCNEIQEELANLVESAGINLDDSENQLARIFTALYVLELTAKSGSFRKSFEGGFSSTAVDGENIRMQAEGTSVDDDSSVELSRLALFFEKTQGGGLSKVVIRPDSIKIRYTTNLDETIETEVDYDQIKTVRLIGLTAVSENGRKLIVDSTLEIGGVENSSRGANLVVNGDTACKQRATVGRLNLSSGSAFLSTANDLVLTSLFVTSSDVIQPKEGDFVVVENTSSSNVKITLQYDVIDNVRKSRLAEIQPGCSMAFVCAGSYHDSAQVIPELDYYRWSPVQNTPISWEVPSA